jgi:ketosteroid isomerase-like protein
MTTTLPTVVPLADAHRINHQVWTESSRLLYAGRIEEFLGYWHRDASYEVAYPIPGMPAAVQGDDALRALFGGFGAAAASIEVQDVTFHQTEDPNVAIVEEQMTAVLHDGSHYENRLIIRVTFRDGLIATMFEYYGEKAHENLLHRLGFAA